MKKLFVVLFAFTFIYGGRVFYDFEKIAPSVIKRSKNYCVRNFKKAKKFCFEAQFEYIDTKSLTHFPFLKSLQKEGKESLNLFEQIDIKAKAKEVAENDFETKFYTKEKMYLFSVNKIAYTIKYIDIFYSGGAHGNYYVSYKNVDKNGKEIKLTDIISDLEGFKKAALTIYKKERGLKPNEALTKDGWFDNKFVLAKEFALTNEGILFTYNPYEIKAFAAGTTTFLVPFNEVKNYINNSFLAPLLKPTKERNYFFVDEYGDKIYIKLTLKQIKKDRFKVYVKFFNFAEFAQKCWLSLSLPQFIKSKDILNLQKSGFESVKIYPKGSKIYNIAKQKAIRAKYLLVEGELEKSNIGEFSFEVTTKAYNFLKIYLRASLKEIEKKELYTFPENDTLKYKSDQQGFSVFEIKVQK